MASILLTSQLAAAGSSAVGGARGGGWGVGDRSDPLTGGGRRTDRAPQERRAGLAASVAELPPGCARLPG